MWTLVSKFIFWLFGWSFIGKIPEEKKYIVISVPHTSMMDFVWGKIAFTSQKLHPIFLIKKESFKFPLNRFLKWLGARPVNRGRCATGLIEQVLTMFKENDEFMLCLTPEGTRRKTKKWKKGFYFISQKADVPVYLGIIDYKDKTCNIGERFIPTGDIKKDMEYINSYYRKHKPTAYNPAKFTLDFS